MPVDAAAVGRSFPPVVYEVGREVLREFAQATAVGAKDPSANRL